MKAKIFAISVILIIIGAAVCGTSAFYTGNGTAVNVITAGGVDAELVELSKDAESGELVPFVDIQNVIPGDSASKIVKVKNTGGHPEWVRLDVQKYFKETESDGEYLTLDFNTEDWTEIDGMWYYNKPLQPGETTEPLFTTVNFDLKIPSEYAGKDAAVSVMLYAVQSENNGSTVEEAAGWPEE